jgi:hypothetical protein
MRSERVEGYAEGFRIGWNIAEERIIKIIKSNIENTYPINCKSILDEIKKEDSLEA